MPMVMSIKDNGRTARPMDMESSLIQTAVCTKDNGSMINNMALALSLGITTKSSTRAILIKARSLEAADSNSRVVIMKATS